MSEKPKVDPEKIKASQDRSKERNLILQEIRSRGPLTVDELARITGLKSRDF